MLFVEIRIDTSIATEPFDILKKRKLCHTSIIKNISYRIILTCLLGKLTKVFNIYTTDSKTSCKIYTSKIHSNWNVVVMY